MPVMKLHNLKKHTTLMNGDYRRHPHPHRRRRRRRHCLGDVFSNMGHLTVGVYVDRGATVLRRSLDRIRWMSSLPCVPLGMHPNQSDENLLKRGTMTTMTVTTTTTTVMMMMMMIEGYHRYFPIVLYDHCQGTQTNHRWR